MAVIHSCSSIYRGSVILTASPNLKVSLVQLTLVLDAAASFGGASDADEAHAESPYERDTAAHMDPAGLRNNLRVGIPTRPTS